MAQYFTMHADFEFCRQKDEKHTEGELENNIPENCAHTLYEQRHTHRQSLHTF